MEFRKIMEKVDVLKRLSPKDMITSEDIDVIYDEGLCYGRDSRIDKGYGQVVIFVKPGLPEQYEKFCYCMNWGIFTCIWRRAYPTQLYNCVISDVKKMKQIFLLVFIY